MARQDSIDAGAALSGAITPEPHTREKIKMEKKKPTRHQNPYARDESAEPVNAETESWPGVPLDSTDFPEPWVRRIAAEAKGETIEADEQGDEIDTSIDPSLPEVTDLPDDAYENVRLGLAGAINGGAFMVVPADGNLLEERRHTEQERRAWALHEARKILIEVKAMFSNVVPPVDQLIKIAMFILDGDDGEPPTLPFDLPATHPNSY